jgi:hypothetical protein
MPLLNDTLLVHFHKVFQHGRLTPAAFRRKHERIVILAIHLVVDLEILVVLPEYFGADRARKVIQMVLFPECVDVRSTECLIALCAQQVEPFKVVRFAEYPNLVSLIF